MFETVLAIHIVVAIMMVVTAFVGVILIKTGRLFDSLIFARSQNAMFAFQLASGALLGFISPTFSSLRFCTSILLYLLIFVIVQAIFYLHTKEDRPRFPIRTAATLTLASLSTTAAVFAL